MRTISMFVLSGLLVVFHIVLAPIMEIFTAKVDFIMISVFLLGIFSKKWYPPVLCAVYSGLAVDITTQASTYINTGIYLFFGILVGVSTLFIKQDRFFVSTVAITVAVAIKHLIYVFLLYVMRFSESFTLTTFFYGLPSALYTFVISAGLFFVYKGLFSFPFMQEKTEDDDKFYI